MKIAITFLTANKLNIFATLSSIQTQFNNLSNVITDLASNQIIYNFKIRESISFINDQTSKEFFFENTRLEYKIEVVEAISYVNAQIKIRYNTRHVSLLLKLKDKTFLRFHKEYKIFSQKNRKLSNQKCEHFLIKGKVERLSYKLNLLLT